MRLGETLDKKKKQCLAKILRKKTKRFLSVDFGAAFIKIAYMESLGQDFKLLNYNLKKITSAEEDKGKITEFITGFLKTNAIAERDVYLTISEPDSVIIKNVVLPAIPNEEILKAAKWELKDEVPFDLEDTLCGWQIVKEYIDEDGAKKNEIIFILARAKTINKYLSYMSDCGLTPVAISSGPFNYAHILRYSKESPAICALLDIGYKDTTLCIYKDNKLIFLRKLTFSSDKLTQSLTTTLVSDKGRLELSYEKAEDAKKTFGIPQDENKILKNNIQAIQVISLIRPLLEQLGRELRRSFDYFTLSFHEESPSFLYITGGGANLNNLDEYLNKALNIHVSKLPFPGCIDRQKLEKERLEKSQNQIINATAAALADPRAINLLPEEIKARKVELIEKVSLRLVTITAGAIFLFSLLVVKFQIGDYQNRLKNARVHLETIKGIKVLQQKVDLQQNLLNKIQGKRVPVDGLLKLISALVPNDIILKELVLETGRHNLVLKGEVLANEDVAGSVLTGFMERMEASLFFSEVSLLSSQKLGEAQGFEIICELVR